MTKDLTTSQIDRQNILNNELAVDEVQQTLNIKTVFWDGKCYFTKELLAEYFEVDIRTVERYISSNFAELSANGYEVLKGARLREFIDAYNLSFATNITVDHKIRSLSVFDFRAFLNMAMLLSESEQARALRRLMLDVVIDLINRKTGGGTKHINQRDKDFLFSSLQEDHSLDEGEHQKFLGAAEDELERLMAENQDVLRRLKERE